MTSREGWETCPVTRIRYGDHVRWLANIRTRPMPKNYHVGVVRDVRALGDDSIEVTVRLAKGGDHTLIVFDTDQLTFQKYVPAPEA